MQRLSENGVIKLTNTELALVARFGKTKGYVLGLEAGLSVSENAWLYTGETDIGLDDGVRYICRPDGPMGVIVGMPRGRTLAPSQFPDFLTEIRRIDSDAALLILEMPTDPSSGRPIDRIDLDGAFVASVEGRELFFEFVGPGFDAGDITRGSCAHLSYNCDVDAVFSATSWDNFTPTFVTSENEYAQSVEDRRNFLLNHGGDERLLSNIPSKMPVLGSFDFRPTCRLLKKLVRFSRQHRTDAGLIANIFRGKYYIFEILLASRITGN